jgi:lipoyl(octanoyl) transferase
MPSIARIIADCAHGAAFNMAADLYLLALCEKSPAVIVRIYTWEKPSITLGITEKPEETLDAAALEKSDVEWIRRPTGGRSVLHQQDITYSCVFSTQIQAMGVTLMETYGIISRGLMNGLKKAGIRCSAHDSPLDPALSRGNVRLPCFLSPNRHEIMVEGKKLLGSAQKRSAKAVLQHGSIPLTPAFRLLPDYLKLSDSQRESQKRMLLQKTTCVSEVQPEYNTAALVRGLMDGFSDSLPVQLVELGFSEQELGEITRYSETEEFLSKWHDGTGRAGARAYQE